jgi:hypothetical protein
MKKTEKKADKATKKSTKKKSTKDKGGFDFNSKQLQKEFNKRMKVLVQEVKKDTEKTIKVLMKEAKQKIHAGSEFVRHDVLKSMMAQYENMAEKVEDVLGIEHEQHKPAAKAGPAKPAARRPAASRSQLKAPATGTTRRPAASGSQATDAATSTSRRPAPPRTRKAAPPMAAASPGEGQAA